MERSDPMAQLVAQAGDDDPIAALGALRALRKEVDQREAVLVRRARVRGASWAVIATMLGVSRQAVHKKYGTGWRSKD